MNNPFATLGIAPTVDLTIIKRAWRSKAHLHHPDKHGDPEKFKECLSAYQRIDTEEKAHREYRLCVGRSGAGAGDLRGVLIKSWVSDMRARDIITRGIFTGATAGDEVTVDFGFASFTSEGWNFD